MREAEYDGICHDRSTSIIYRHDDYHSGNTQKVIFDGTEEFYEWRVQTELEEVARVALSRVPGSTL